MMALAGFAEEDRFDGAARAKRFFDQADAFDADGAGFCGQAATERQAELLEPAIVPAGEERRGAMVHRATRGFAWGGHYRGG